MPLPATERVLLGPGPSLIPPRVIRALAAPVLSHLDPDFVPMLDEVRASLQRVFLAAS
jgi:alanine-glyoxylate transaminase/serine-glyoxylate transaminase/serine-pyruvate transaminase